MSEENVLNPPSEASGHDDAITEVQDPLAEWKGQLPPMEWMERLPQDHPRYRIRIFLHCLFRYLGSELPEAWPNVEPTVFRENMGFLEKHLHSLYQYVDSQDAFDRDKQLMPRYLGETTLYLMRVDYENPELMHTASEESMALLEERPHATIDFDQLYCSPDSTERRANRIRELYDVEGCRVAMIGDDDLVSILLGQNFQGEVHVLDLDDRLLNFIKEKAPAVQTHKADFFFDGIDSSLYQTFDAAMLDPPWTLYHMWCFLDKAIFCLKDDPNARIFLSYCPLLLEHRQEKLGEFQRRVALRGFTFDSVETAYNLYELSPEVQPDFQNRLDQFLPSIASPLLDFLRQIPYAHAQLYVLRRIPNYKPPFWRRWFFYFWNKKSSVAPPSLQSKGEETSS